VKKRINRSKLQMRGNRGSALLVSLMVIAGLSLLGLAFVTISETEKTIAKNQLTVVQGRAIAEAGGILVIQWFQSPTWGNSTAGMPSNDASVNPNILKIKTKRTWGGTGAYSDYYKPDGSTMLLDKPYRPGANDRFYGDENSADIIINNSTDKTTIDNINTILLGTLAANDRMSGEISEIKVFAPPIVSGVLTPNGTATNADGTPQKFWVNGSRFGTATIKVTATQYRDPSLAMPAKTATANIIASHAVRFVVGEIPLPIPGGPIQSNTNINFGGDFMVHWGNETSTGDLTNVRNPVSLPWANAYERPHFEHGFEPGSSLASITVTNGGSGYTVAPTVNIAGGHGAVANATIAGGVVTAITLTNRGTGYVPNPPSNGGTPSWGPAVTFSGGGGGTGATALANIGSEVWPISSAQFEDGDYLHELLGKSFDDPWFGSRAVGDNQLDGTTTYPQFPQCNSYTYTNDEVSTAQKTYGFQWQGVNTFPYFKRVIFPTIKYTFWKQIATNSRGLTGIYYFTYDSASGNFKLNGNGAAQPVATWVNINTNGMGPGVYFFDTVNGINPQVLTGAARAAQLTPGLNWKSSDFGGSFLMQGFIYLNASSFGTTGMGSSATTIQSQFPGEPYRDLGYPKWDPVAGNWDTSCGGSICRVGAGDAVFSYQDLNGNGVFDVVTMPAPAWTSWDSGSTPHAAGSMYVVKTWKSPAQATADYGAPCTVPGTNPATDCTEPSEPYLNLIYPSTNAGTVKVGWEASNAQTRRAKKLDNVGNPVSCAGTPSAATCTSNAFDLDGGIVPLDTILDGILYNEGDYSSTGNATYYGSLLIQGQVLGHGTPDIWFDESLIKGTWAPPNMPRVMIFSEQTDEIQQ
jgi:hypothetical protein